jgi:hypothetical protein
MHLTTSSIARVCGAAAALLVLGCGSSSINGGGGGDPAAAVAGSWTFTSGSIQPMCNLTIAAVDLTGDTMTIVRVDSTHVTTSLMGNGLMCNVNFTVSGTTATATAGQTCVVTVPVGTTSTAVVIDISSWTLTISGDTLTNAMAGTATAAGILTCTPTADGMATRVSSGG